MPLTTLERQPSEKNCRVPRKTDRGPPLPPRERAGVRGKGPSSYPLASKCLSPISILQLPLDEYETERAAVRSGESGSPSSWAEVVRSVDLCGGGTLKRGHQTKRS